MEKDIFKKIINREEYKYLDDSLNEKRLECKSKCYEYNTSLETNPKKQKEFIKTIINIKTDNFYINKKFNCNLGNNIFIGDNFYSSFNLTIIDENLVNFGNNIYIGPNCTFDTIRVPLEKDKRSERLLSTCEITIGNNVFFEGSIKISYGVTIGDNVIVKAGSIVDKDIPNNSLVEGNPCKIKQSNISFNYKNFIQDMIGKELKDENYLKSKKICNEFNNSKFESFEIINEKISKLFKSYKSLYLTQNAYIQNGNNSSVGEVFYSNYNFVLIDSAKILAGNNVFLAPNCTINSNVIEYNESKKEYLIESKPIKIGDNVWIASNVYIKGGVTIGDNTTIGAGSIVDSNIPDNCLAFGNPAKVFRKFDIIHRDRIKEPNDKRSEKEISLNEELYFTGDEELKNDRLKSFKITSEYNNILNPKKIEQRNNLLRKHLNVDNNTNFEIDNYFNVDYGYNVHIGKNFKSFHNFIILDENEVNIGDNVTIGPNVTLLCALHPIEDVIARNSELEYAKKVNIGNDVWIKGNTIILPGVKIGNNVIIENGSIVTKNIPDNSYCSGIPCKVLNYI